MIFLATVAGSLLQSITDSSKSQEFIHNTFDYSEAMRALVDCLQRERGLSATFTSNSCYQSPGCREQTLPLVLQARANTDAAFARYTKVVQGLRLKKILDKDPEFTTAYYRLVGSLKEKRDQLSPGPYQPGLSLSYINFYTSIVIPLIVSVSSVENLAPGSRFRGTVYGQVDIMMMKEKAAVSRGLGSSLWGLGAESASVIQQFQQSVSDVTSFADVYMGRAAASEVALVKEIMELPATRSVLALFDLISRNETKAMAVLGPSAFFKNASYLVDSLSSVEAAQVDRVIAMLHSSRKVLNIVLVSLSFAAMLFAGTVLTWLFVASIRSSNRILARSLLKSRETDAQLRKFVPTKLSNLFEVQNPLALTMGMRSNRFFTVLYARLQDFDAQCEHMPLDDMFDRLLDFSSVVNPIVSYRGGFVDSWIGPSVYAVFTSAEDAVFAALEITVALKGLNLKRSVTHATTPQRQPQRPLRQPAAMMPGAVGDQDDEEEEEEEEEGEDEEEQWQAVPNAPTITDPPQLRQTLSQTPPPPPPQQQQQQPPPPPPPSPPPKPFQFLIGIGIHTGSAIAGIVGDAEHVISTIIGDAIDTATRLESMCQRLGGDLFISEHTRLRLRDPRKIEMRSVGLTRFAGRKEPLEVWEVYEGNDELIKSVKRRNESALARAVSLVMVGDRREAEEHLRYAVNESALVIRDTALETTATIIKAAREQEESARDRPV